MSIYLSSPSVWASEQTRTQPISSEVLRSAETYKAILAYATPLHKVMAERHAAPPCWHDSMLWILKLTLG